MSKIKTIARVAKQCINDPEKLKKGLDYLKENGIGELQNKIKKSMHIYSPDVILQQKSKPEDVFYGDIKFSVVMPVYNVEIKWLQKAIESVERQNYKNWELCIADDCSTNPEVKEYLKGIKNERIKIFFREENGGISEATNSAVSLATGQYIVLMDNDDELTYDALYEFVRAVKEENADIIYSDQNIIDSQGRGRDPLYKPDWSPDLLLSQMYIGHLLGFRKSLFEEVGGFRSKFNGSQDYDLVLRMIEKTDRIVHVPAVLYGWRDIPSSTAANPQSKPYAQTAGLMAIQEHLDRTLGEGKAIAKETEDLFVYDVRYIMEDTPLVSIIIPTKDHVELLADVIASIYEKTTYNNYEILILNNNSEEEKTYQYFEKVQKEHSNLQVIEASYEFNWSKLNNHGIREAKGDVFIFMNNDMSVITEDWMDRLVEKAVQQGKGVIGGLLLYEDDTIQHAGVVVGICGYADHIYKGMKPVHYGSPFISPMVTRNVTACTGALMAVSRKTIEKIGNFDEDFIICGSDIELCIRASNRGLENIYDPHVKLYHYESKSRDSYIPPVDFEMSEFFYRMYTEEGDPFYNKNLDYTNVIPKVTSNQQFVRKESDIMRFINNSNKETLMSDSEVQIPEIFEFQFRKSEFKEKRLNLLVPSINPEHVFGGISTALKFFDELLEKSGYASRLILTDAAPSRAALKSFEEKYRLVKSSKDCEDRHQIVPYNSRYGASIPVSENDIFVFTGWWTAYCTQTAYAKYEREEGIKPNPFIYFIQDYEPGFYPWSSRYLLADSTYRSQYQQIAVFNSNLLYEFFKKEGYSFYKEYSFDPVLNAGLKKVLLSYEGKEINKKKKILVYGRPSTERNAFALVVASLREFVDRMDNIDDWEIVSAGEYHDSVDLGKGKRLVSVGKMSIEEYGKCMLETYAGISLMSSPHPSYPPLEMSEFGVKVITNTYANKDLSEFNENIISVDNVSPVNIAGKLLDICQTYKEDMVLDIKNKGYVENTNVFSFIPEIIENLK
ncbi:glycosyltransferase family 2 protein [Anaerostipes sp.]|uniref:glycosyltransferase family 2 protein n=1 Tax=Anaerostipes sp. TaxID=1872530 RepID=UPI00258E630C|nr:glycosyltransferase [Anaerostipes sp.]MCI5623378.1 glycosyltransferase [Anaerostipes sp.]